MYIVQTVSVFQLDFRDLYTKCSSCSQVHVQNCAFLGSFVISVQSVLLAVRYMYKLYLYAGFSVISVHCAFLAIM